jgi:dTDP-4-dehydrorhamnose 3,5-epimerase
MPFIFKPLSIPDVILVEPKAFGDARGFFLETYKASEFEAAGINETFVQDNFSFSKQNVLRGLHFQIGANAQGKLVKAISGKIWDVAVDVRKSSPTFGKWVGVELSEENNLSLYVPAGFAHGFEVLDDNTRVLYKCTKEYNHSAERGIKWDDPALAIVWPIAKPIINGRDAAFPLLKDAAVFE